MDNENLERPNYYAVIPANVRYSDASSSAKLLYGEITALCNKTGTCWASNNYFSKLYGVSIDSITRWIKELVNGGFITTKIVKSAGNRRYLSITDVPIRKNTDTYPQKDQVNNNTINKSNIVELEKELLQIANKITNRNFRVLPRGTKKLLNTFSLVEIEAALRAEAADEWHKPRLKELSLDYMIRPATIDKFMAQAKPVTNTDDVKRREAKMDAEMAAFRRGEDIDKWREDHKDD